jgi:hypothetical protein
MRYGPLLALLLAACRPVGAPETQLPSQPLRSIADFPNWEAAQNAGWDVLRHSAYCIQVPAGVKPICLIGKGIDRCSFVVNASASTPEPPRFSITVVPPGLAISRPDEFLLADGTFAPLSTVQQQQLNEESSWEITPTPGTREVHVVSEHVPYWLIIQYETLTPEESLLADRMISTILIPGRGPNTEDTGPACPFSRKKRKGNNQPD